MGLAGVLFSTGAVGAGLGLLANVGSGSATVGVGVTVSWIVAVGVGVLFSAGFFSAAGELAVFADFAGGTVEVGLADFRGLGVGVGLFAFPDADFFGAGVGVGSGGSLLILSPRPTPGALVLLSILSAAGLAVGEFFGAFLDGDGEGFAFASLGSSRNIRDNKERFAGVADGEGVGVGAAQMRPEKANAIETIQPRVLRFINKR